MMYWSWPPLGAPTSPSAHTRAKRSGADLSPQTSRGASGPRAAAREAVLRDGGSGGGVVENVWCRGSGLAAGSLMPPEASGEVGGAQHAWACCCTGPGGPVRGRRSAVGGALAMDLRTFSLLMGSGGCSQTVPVWSTAASTSSSILLHLTLRGGLAC